MSLFGIFDTQQDNPTTNTSTTTNTQTTNTITPGTWVNGTGLAVSSVNNGNDNTVVNNVTNNNMDAAVAVHAIDANTTINQDSLLFADHSQQMAYAAVRDQVGGAYSFANGQVAMSNATTAKAIDATGMAYQDALSFGAHQTGAALDSLNTSANMIAAAYQDSKGTNNTTTKAMLIAVGVIGLIAMVALHHGK